MSYAGGAEVRAGAVHAGRAGRVGLAGRAGLC
jgi:hypothetical protein